MKIKRLQLEKIGAIKSLDCKIEKPVVIFYPKTSENREGIGDLVGALMHAFSGGKINGRRWAPLDGTTIRILAETKGGSVLTSVDFDTPRPEYAFEQCRKEALEALFFVNPYDMARYTFNYGHNFEKAVGFDCKLNEYRRIVDRYRKGQPKNAKEQAEKAFWCKCVQDYLDDACYTHIPQAIRKDKNLYMTVNTNDYVMQAKRIVGGEEESATDLSDQDRVIFEYLCYLEVNKFWQKVNQSFGENAAEELPLVITGFLGRLDNVAPLDELLNLALATEKQVFVLSEYEPKFDKLKTRSSVQFVAI